MDFLGNLFKKKQKAATPNNSEPSQISKQSTPSEKGQADMIVMICPSCGHRFEYPRNPIIFVLQAVIDKYGPNPVQCPNCRHIWSQK